MRSRIARAYIAVFGAGLFLAACQSIVQPPLGNQTDLATAEGGSPASIHFSGARPSHEWMIDHGIRRRLTFPTPIQHVVVIVMENRTVDNLFAGYYGKTWKGPNGGHWQDPDNLDLYNPNATPTLVPNGLSQHFSPSHHHDTSWSLDSQGNWNQEPIDCPKLPCPSYATAYSYVPTRETEIYKRLVEQWAFADNVLQANQGPSFVSHQYLIAGQSGGIEGSLTSPDAEAEEPGIPHRDPTKNYVAPDEEDVLSSGCNPSGSHVPSVDMSLPVPAASPDNGGRITACEEYRRTILDEATRLGGLAYDDWQYIANSDLSIWAAPLGVEHLWKDYNLARNKGTEPFAVDPNAQNFALNISGSTKPTPNPARPFAALTYITPCLDSSDHPLISGRDDGPQWLAWVINAIGESRYWKSTTIIVTWDDWGGWFDHVPAVPAPGPFRPYFNGYRNHDDPNEWGFRVPLIVISPYIKGRGYISNPKTSFRYRSQGVITQYVEATLGLPSLGTDDIQDHHSDGLQDVFNFARSPLPYVPIRTPFVPGEPGICPGASS
jgi:hypothetical protein